MTLPNHKSARLHENEKRIATDPGDRVRVLRDMLAEHDRLYYIENQPIITDFEYDRLYQELVTLEQQHPELVTSDSPTMRVGGAPLSAFHPVRHKLPMLSLANTYNRAELKDFYARTAKLLPDVSFTFVIEPKIDGVAVTLRYQDGVFTTGASRGNGLTGDDITANLRAIRTVPLRLTLEHPPAVLEVRGEVFMPRTDFAALNRARIDAGEPSFANPRNAAAGSLKLLDARLVAERSLAIIFYGAGELAGVAPATHNELLEYYKQAGLPPPPRWWVCATLDELMSALDELENIRAKFPFETDGAVIKVNQRTLYERLGATAKSPRWAVAFKFAPETAATRLRDITVQVGRTGVLTPVAELEPVALAGSTIERATLHNADEIARRDIRIGDLVTIEKAGDVIPAIIAVDTSARTGQEKTFVMPARCPACDSPVTRQPNATAWRCENMQCPEQLKRWISHFAARNAMDIADLGEAMIEQLVEKKILRDPADLYALTAYDLAGERVDRVHSKSVQNLLAGIAASKDRPLHSLIFALGIRHVGAGTANALEQHFESLDVLMQATSEELTNIRDVGPAAATAVVTFFQTPRNQDFIQRLRKANINFRRLADAPVADPNFAGRAFVLTGTLTAMSRTQAENEIRRRGGKVSASLSKKTNVVIAGDNPGSKLEKARQLEIPVWSEKKFLQHLATLTQSSATDAPDIAPATLARPGELPLI